jgi:hypothetical protein
LQIDVQGDPVSHKPGRPIIYTKSTNPANKKISSAANTAQRTPARCSKNSVEGWYLHTNPPAPRCFAAFSRLLQHVQHVVAAT